MMYCSFCDPSSWETVSEVGVIFIRGVWSFDADDLGGFDSVDFTIRYDDALTHALGLNEELLKLWTRQSTAEWIVSLGASARPVRARIGAGLEPIVDEPAVRIVNISGVNGNLRNIACMELPAKLFGKDWFQAGDTIEFSSTFFTHCRAYRVEWKGGFSLRAKERLPPWSG